MRKIIIIGKSTLDVIFENNLPVSSFPGGRMINIAASTSSAGIPTSVISECGADNVGDIIVDYLSNLSVDTKSIDRFTDGRTPLTMIFPDKTEIKRIKYGKYPANRFDVIWPRIDEDDIVVFGSFYAIDPELRLRLFELITYAVERKAIIIYLPGFHRETNYRITKVMTAILENLEIANIVIANASDAQNIFDSVNTKDIFNKKIAFYCPNYIQVDNNYNATLFLPKSSKTFSNNNDNIVNSLSWHSGFCGGIIYGLAIHDIKRRQINNIDSETWESILKYAHKFAANSHESGTNCISPQFGNNCKIELNNALQDNNTL